MAPRFFFCPMKNISTFVLLFSFHLTFAQKQDFVWLISHVYGSTDATQLNFNFNPVQIEVLQREMHLSLTRASICDSSGNLLFYTNGKKIVNNTGETLENGDSLNYGFWYNNVGNTGYNVPQGAFFIPKPGDDSTYYLFHMFMDFEAGTIPLFPRYSVIDKRQNNGLGKVVEKNVEMLTGDPLTNYIQATAVRHANGRDWWVIVPGHMGPQYYRFLLSPNGLEGPWEQEIGFRQATTDFTENGFGQRAFSLDGSKFVDYDYDNFTQVFDFDRCTGLLSNARMIDHGIDPAINNGGAGIAFSPSGQFLYLTRTNNGYTLFQYDTEAVDILSSEVVVYDCPLIGQQVECGVGNMLLAPDGKIYIGGADTISYSIIHQPDSLGLACGFELGGLTFPLAYPSYYFPYWPNYRLGALEGSGCDTIASSAVVPLHRAASLQVYPNPSRGPATVAYELPTGMEAELRVVDALGRVVRAQQGITGKGSLALEALPSGIYLVCLVAEGEVVRVEKMVFR